MENNFWLFTILSSTNDFQVIIVERDTYVKIQKVVFTFRA